MSSFRDASEWAQTAPGVFQGVIDESWYQGRGAFGGLLGGAILRGMIRTVASGARVPRSLTVHYCAPAVAGPVELKVHVERAGSSVSHVSARVEQQGEAVCLATATFAQSRRSSTIYLDAVMPKVAPAVDRPSVSPDVPGFPVFARNHFDYRFATDREPYCRADEALLHVWIKPRVPQRVDAPMAMGLIDAPPPAVLARLETLQAAATVDLTTHFFTALPLEDRVVDEHHLLFVRSRQAADGYTEQLTELWSPSGQLLAQCRQLVALLG
ncbi:MAG: thioesterase family protein [Myxococcota bacterium]